MKYGFGVDLGGTTAKIAFFDKNCTLLTKWEIPTVTADGGKQILPDIASAALEYVQQQGMAKGPGIRADFSPHTCHTF